MKGMEKFITADRCRRQTPEMHHLLMSCRHAQGVMEEHFHGGHHDCRVGVAEPVIQDIHEVIHLLLSGWPIVRGKLQHLTLCPL